MEIVNPLLDETWDQRLKHYKEATIFHSAAWAKVLHETYRFTPGYLVYHQGILPLMEANSPLTGKKGVALPFTDSCEPLGFDEDSFQNVLKRITEYGKKRGWKYWEIRGGEGLFRKASGSLSFYVHSLLMGGSETRMFDLLESSTRRAIKKAEKSDLQVEITQSEQSIHDYYRLHCHTRKKHGVPPQPFSLFANIQRYILQTGLGCIVMARLKGLPVAADIFFRLGKHATYKFGASDGRFQEFRASNLVMWRGIQWCLQNGIETLDFGRTSLNNEGLRRFKLGWGTTEETKSYYKFDLRKNSYVAEADRASGWHNTIFRNMPLPLLRASGSFLYRHMA